MDLLDSPILGLFFNDQSLTTYPREIARRTGLHPNTVLTRLRSLERAGLLSLRPSKALTEVRACTQGAAFCNAKRLWNLHQVLASGITEHLYGLYNAPDAIILFGSFARGEDVPRSDIDIAVVTPKNLRPQLDKFNKILKHPVQITEVKAPPKELLTSLANGVVLKGYLEL
jgi:predicted nucleotidyltransferase